MKTSIKWNDCLENLKNNLSAKEYNTWIKPLQYEEIDNCIKILAPNSFVFDILVEKYAEIMELAIKTYFRDDVQVTFEIGSNRYANDNKIKKKPHQSKFRKSGLQDFTFESFISGKSNQIARAAAIQVSESPGKTYNPLFISGGVGLGKTHLMHAVGNLIKKLDKNKKPVYVHSEAFVQDMVRALQHNKINDFKKFYRSVDALLIDDIQFFGGKERSQEEFFHTFNNLLESKHQIVLTCDSYPKEVTGVEERLKSRFGWGLSVNIEPPELETRVAILMSKAQLMGVNLPDEVAFLIGKRFRANVRELEGALHRVVANSNFTGHPITLDFAKEALKDLLALQDKTITLQNIQKTVAEYYKIRLADILSKRRNRSIARPRQIAMALSKELTTHSLPEIGDAFGGRDHTTVIHACKKISELKITDARVQEDYSNLDRILSS